MATVTVTLGIRPEHIYLHAPSGAGALANVPAMIEVVEPVGNEIFIYFSIGANNRISSRAYPPTMHRRSERRANSCSTFRGSICSMPRQNRRSDPRYAGDHHATASAVFHPSLHVRSDSMAGWQIIGNADSYVVRGGNTVLLKVVRSIRRGQPAERSSRPRALHPAVGVRKGPAGCLSGGDPDPLARPVTEIADAPGALTLTTRALRVTIAKKPIRITITDSTGRILTQDHPDKGMSWVASPSDRRARVADDAAGCPLLRIR